MDEMTNEGKFEGAFPVLETERFLWRDYAFLKGQFLDGEVYSLLKREFAK